MAAPLYRNVHLADGGILSVAALDLQPQQVLSTAMPTPAQVGMLAYATDTFQLLQYQSATTGWTPPWNLAWGVQAETVVTSNQTGITTIVDIANLGVSFTAVANRKYRCWLTSWSFSDSTTAGTATISIWQGVLGTQTAQLAAQQPFNAASGVGAVGSTTVATKTITGLAAGTQGFHGRAAITAGTMNTNGAPTTPLTIWVEDIGPSANPA